jgi:lipooligosaccharide transport system permease protein
MTFAVKVLQRNLLVYRRTFRGSIFSSFVTPLLYLTAMGVGLGQLISSQGRGVIGGYEYTHFLGPGLLAASCM